MVAVALSNWGNFLQPIKLIATSRIKMVKIIDLDTDNILFFLIGKGSIEWCMNPPSIIITE